MAIVSKASRRCAASRPGRATPGRVPRRHLVGLPCGLRATGSQCLAGVRFARKLALASPRSRGGSVVLCQPRSHARGGGGAGSGALAAGRDWGRLALLTFRGGAWINSSSSSTTSAAIVYNGRQGTSTEPPLIPTQPSSGPWDLVAKG